MFTPEHSRSILSPFSSRNTSRRSISTPVSASQSNRSLLKGNRRSLQPRPSIPSRILEETPLHRVETYGLPLPVQVNEIITGTTERSPPASVHLDSSGWAWLVFERRLLVWKYMKSSTDTSKVAFCKEFLLPPTELYHSTKLVCLVGSPGLDYRQHGVLAVSPEGLVYYWPSMTYDSSPIETETELVGQEFHSLVEFQPLGYILTTTTNDILLLTLQKKSISFHRFRSPGGVFSGFSRRMSSFIFGADQTSSARLRKIVVDDNTEESSRGFYVLSENNLSKWVVSGDRSNINEMVEMDLNVGALFEQQAVQQLQVSLDKMKCFCCDAQMSSTGVSILSAVLVESQESEESRMYYFIGTVVVDPNNEEFGRFTSFVQLRFAEVYQEELHQKLLDFNFLIPGLSKQAFVYSENIIVCSSVQNTEDVLNKVEFHTEGDGIWGSGFSENKAIFFSRKHGIVSISVTAEATSVDEPERLLDAHKSDVSMAIQEEVAGSDDVTVLRMAFLQFCQGHKDQSQIMCEERFSNVTQLEGSSVLDATVASVSKEVIDDYPASDPRWAEAIPADSGSSSASLIIIHQLEDKLKAHNYFVQFLKETMLFDKLSTITVHGRVMCTRHLLCEYAEKLNFAVALRRQHNQHQELVDHSIGLVLKERKEDTTPKGLTQQDLFYREVSRISDIICCLLDCEKQRLSQHKEQIDHQNFVIAVNSILESALHEAWQYRQLNAINYTASDGDEPNVEFLPWTASCGPDGTRPLLLEQLEITFDRALSIAEDQKNRSVLIQQVVDLADIILDGYVTQVNSLRNLEDKSRLAEITEKYAQDRHQVIGPLASRGDFEEALSLAEKYRDFDILIEICEETHDQEKLQQYMIRFSEEGFSEFAFKWYMDRGERSKLMSQPKTQHENLSKFLSSHDHLKWLHDIERHSFYQAYETLAELGKKEEHYLSRKKTLLSLGMLALLASDEREDQVTPKLEEISKQQIMITHQETIPVDVLRNARMDPISQPPVSPKQLIELYIGEGNKNCDEGDFKKALDILHIAFAGEAHRSEYETLREQIWCKAILRDDWSKIAGEETLVIARDTIFFKTVELAFNQGFDLTSCMPSLESFLVADELVKAGLAENTSFQYFLRAGYEQILRLQDDAAME